MKRSKVIRGLVKVLKPWESSMLDKKCANEILLYLEQIGIITPPSIKVDTFKFLNDNGVMEEIDVESCQWEKER
jgi:hypothetical protein